MKKGEVNLNWIGEQNPNWKGGKIEVKCATCGKPFLIFRSRLGIRKHCSKKCSRIAKTKQMKEARTGPRNPLWKGGRHKNKNGYWEITLSSVSDADKTLALSMARSRHSILEHRFIVAKALHRPLEKFELVHHKNGIRDDNRLENLELISPPNIRQRHYSRHPFVRCPKCGYQFPIILKDAQYSF